MKNLQKQFLFQHRKVYNIFPKPPPDPALSESKRLGLRKSPEIGNRKLSRLGGIFLCYSESGAILIISVWIIVFFSILSLSLYKIITSQIKMAGVIENRIIGLYIAKAAVRYGQCKILKKEAGCDTLYKLGVVEEKEIGRGKFLYVMKDEERKININTAAAEVLANLPGLNAVLAQNIYSSTLKPFSVIEEILLIDGITEEVYKSCRDFITIYSDNSVNINTALPEVLIALGLDSDIVNVIKQFRAGIDLAEATEDDGFFEDTNEIIEKLRLLITLSLQQQEIILQLISQGLISVKSSNFYLIIDIQILDKLVMKYNIIMDGYGVKQWIEY